MFFNVVTRGVGAEVKGTAIVRTQVERVEAGDWRNEEATQTMIKVVDLSKILVIRSDDKGSVMNDSLLRPRECDEIIDTSACFSKVLPQ